MVYKLVYENLKHRPVRTLLSSLAIGLGVTMMLALVGVGEGMLEDQANRARGVGADLVVRAPGSSVVGMGSLSMNQKILDYVRARPHVTLATPIGIHSTGGVSSIMGINYDEFAAMSGGFRFREGGKFTAPDDVIIDDLYAREKKLKVGSVLHTMNRDWRVSGIFASGKLARVMIPLTVLQELASANGKITMIYVKLDNPANTQAVIDAMKQDLPEYPIYAMEELIKQFSVNNLPELKAFIGVVVSLAVLFGFLVVFLAMYTAVLERTREIGILKALGAGPGYVLGILLRETVLLAIIGSLCGIAMSYGTRWLIATFIPASMVQAIVYSWWPIASLITLAGAILGVLYPALKAARQDALDSLSYD